MTVVVAVKDKKNNDVIIGSDSMITSDNLCRKMEEPKYFIKQIPLKSSKEVVKIVVGEAGALGMLEYMKQVFVPPLWDKDNESFKTYMLGKFFPEFKQLLNDLFYVGKGEDESIDIFSHLLIIFDGEFYKMSEDLSFNKHIEDFCCIGSGKEVAMGSLHSTYLNENVRFRVNMAILAAGDLTTYVNDDIMISSVSELLE